MNIPPSITDLFVEERFESGANFGKKGYLHFEGKSLEILHGLKTGRIMALWVKDGDEVCTLRGMYEEEKFTGTYNGKPIEITEMPHHILNIEQNQAYKNNISTSN